LLRDVVTQRVYRTKEFSLSGLDLVEDDNVFSCVFRTHCTFDAATARQPHEGVLKRCICEFVKFECSLHKRSLTYEFRCVIHE
jgi:hypothetical protein